jgi:drug/metabolite transporter (DMT)-like permease
MCFAAFISCSVLYFRVLRNPGYSSHIRTSFSSGAVTFPRIIICGILNYGFPHSLITLSQRTVTSTAVTLSQPLISVVTLFTMRFVFPDEKITIRKLLPQILAITGTFLTSIPSFGGNIHYDKATQIFDYCLLGVAVLAFGFGSVYLKWAFPSADALLLCAGQLAASAVYGFLFCLYQMGPEFMFVAFKNIALHTIGWSALLGFGYTFTSSMLWIYVVREFGPVKANFANFGQIVIGVLAGVIFLGEWEEYSRKDIGLSLIGLGFLALSLLIGFVWQDKTEKRRDYIEVRTIL